MLTTIEKMCKPLIPIPLLILSIPPLYLPSKPKNKRPGTIIKRGTWPFETAMNVNLHVPAMLPFRLILPSSFVFEGRKNRPRMR